MIFVAVLYAIGGSHGTPSCTIEMLCKFSMYVTHILGVCYACFRLVTEGYSLKLGSIWQEYFLEDGTHVCGAYTCFWCMILIFAY